MKIKRIVLHCSAARPGQASRQTAADIDRMHRKERGWRKIGYHYFIRTDGTLERGRDENEVGAGVFGFNTGSIHICYAGGLDENGKAVDTRTAPQRNTMAKLVFDVAARHKVPDNGIMGHRDLSPDKDGDGVVEPHEWLKECPCFSVAHWWQTLNGKD